MIVVTYCIIIHSFVQSFFFFLVKFLSFSAIIILGTKKRKERNIINKKKSDESLLFVLHSPKDEKKKKEKRRNSNEEITQSSNIHFNTFPYNFRSKEHSCKTPAIVCFFQTSSRPFVFSPANDKLSLTTTKFCGISSSSIDEGHGKGGSSRRKTIFYEFIERRNWIYLYE